MHRGISTGPDQQGGWATEPAGRRPPSASRERKPLLAVLAVLLIAGGALGAYYLVTQNAKRVAAIEITKQVSAGQKFPLSAMSEVQIPANSGVNYVPWSEASQVAQFYAGNAIPPGTLLNGAMVVRASNLTAGRDVLGLALKDGQLPDDLQVGDHIDIYEVQNGKPGCPGFPGEALTQNALVLAITTPSAGSGSTTQDDVLVALNPPDAGAVACSAANGIVGIAVLPGGGQQAAPGPSTSPGPQTSSPATTHRRRGHPGAGSSPSPGVG